jgi:hypothetical protein
MPTAAEMEDPTRPVQARRTRQAKSLIGADIHAVATLYTVVCMHQSHGEMPLEIGAIVHDNQIIGTDIQAEQTAFTALAIQLYGR